MAKLRIAKWEAKQGSILTANGLIRVNSNKPEYGSLMMITTTLVVGQGFANTKPRVGFLTGRVSDLENIISEYNLREGDDFSAKVAPHRIVTIELKESEVPANKGFRPKMNPTTGELLTKEGEQIYWKTEIVPEGSDLQDRFLQHDIVTQDEAIREFQSQLIADTE